MLLVKMENNSEACIGKSESPSFPPLILLPEDDHRGTHFQNAIQTNGCLLQMCMIYRKWWIKGITALGMGLIPSVSCTIRQHENMTQVVKTSLLLGFLGTPFWLLLFVSFGILSHLPPP